MAAQDLDVSEPRRPDPENEGAPWVVDVVKGGSKVLATLDVTPELLPPRKNAKGRVVWSLPSEISQPPRLGLKDKERVLEAYKVQRKKRKEANHEKAKELSKAQKKVEKKRRWAATRLQAEARRGFARDAIRLKRQERAVEALAGSPPPSPPAPARPSVGARARARAAAAPAAPPPVTPHAPRPRPPPDVVVDAPLADRQAWCEQWKARVVAHLDDLARDAWAAAARRADAAPRPAPAAVQRYAPPAAAAPPGPPPGLPPGLAAPVAAPAAPVVPPYAAAPLSAAPAAPVVPPPYAAAPLSAAPAAPAALPYDGDVQAAMRNQDRAAIRQIMKARGTQETRRASAPAALPPPGLAQSSPPTELPEMPETISFLRSSPLGIRL
jgi:hypothetical protein